MTDLERLIHENAQLNRQVTDVQRRCTELLLENRELKKLRTPADLRREEDLRCGLDPKPESERLALLSGADLLREAARGLRKLAARYPEPPPGGECGEHSRTYYEMLAKKLERLT